MVGGTISMIKSLGTDKVIVGNNSGSVSYSADGANTWTKVPKAVGDAGNVQVDATGVATNDYIFVVTDVGTPPKVWRWQIGVSADWIDLTSNIPTTAGTTFKGYGIELTDKNILYVMAYDTTGNAISFLGHSLNPTSSGTVYWSGLPYGAAAPNTRKFNDLPQAFTVNKVGTTGYQIWAIDTTASTGGLYNFKDTVALVGPTLNSPAKGFQNPVNPITGRSVDVQFSWNNPSDYVSNYELKVYTDAATNFQVGSTISVSSTSATASVLAGPFTNGIEYAPGSTYYWKVRVNGVNSVTPATGNNWYSQYSEVRDFSIQPGVALVTKPLSPINGAANISALPSFSWEPISGTTEYTFVLSKTPDLKNPVVNAKVAGTAYAVTTALDPGTTYFWAVTPTAPVAGGQSSIANFTTAPKATVAPTSAPPVTITVVPAPTFTIPAPAPAPTIIIPTPAPPPAQIAPGYIWAIIIIGAVLVIAVIVLIVRTRRTV